jgi:methionyl-tRNA synthetase
MPKKVSKETGSVVEWTSEENYCFALSKFQKNLEDFYLANPAAIVPKNYYLDVLKTLSEPLEDISISRPRSRLSWGIEVPGDPEQTIYVWFDALVNYLTVTGYPWSNNSQPKVPVSEETRTSEEDTAQVDGAAVSRDTAWPASVHVIGKDIVRYVA